MTPRVSVVATVYNGEPYFDRAVPGILAQTFEDFEFVLVDDGSTDGTLPLLRELAARDARVRVFAPGRLGAARAYNFGVEQARGEYVARQDFDDRSYPDRLRLQVALLDARPKVGIVGGAYLLVDERRGERYVRMPPTDPAVRPLVDQALTIWLENQVAAPLCQFYHRIPFNTTYWTNWPTEQNPYVNGAHWHLTFAMVLWNLQPT